MLGCSDLLGISLKNHRVLAEREGLILSLRSFTPAGRTSCVQIGFADLSNPIVYVRGFECWAVLICWGSL